MSTIPSRFISDESKVTLIKEGYCGNCKLNRRTGLKQIFTPGNELGADIWSTKDIFGLSVNIDLCNIGEFSFESFKDDVNIILEDYTLDRYFESDEQLKVFDIEKIKVQKLDTLIVYMVINELLSIQGTYPFKKDTPDEKIYKFKLRLLYKPMVLNVFHFQVEVISDESGNWEQISRENKKKYIRALASKIRAKILEENKVYPLILK